MNARNGYDYRHSDLQDVDLHSLQQNMKVIDMSWILTEKEIAPVLQLDGPNRYEYLIKKAADEQRIWSLWEHGGWALAEDSNGQETVPVWPHKKYAELCTDGQWANYAPRAISLKDWMERWIPGIQGAGRLLAAFPTPNDRGVAVDPLQVASDLQKELANYE